MKKYALHFVHRSYGGFTLIETLVSVAIFLILTLTVFQISSAIIKETTMFREQIVISGLADQYMEIARNLPYSQVGTQSGNPHGNLPDLPNKLTTTVNGNTYNIYYVVDYVDDPADGTALAGTDFASDDYKQVKLYIKNTVSGVTKSFLTTIVPKGLENLAQGGALSIKVFNALGQPVPYATISIRNSVIVPNINLTRTSDSNGNWVEVGLPDSAQNYHIVVTKSGYSSDQTYPITGQNPNPTKPDATIANGQVTQVSFSIDTLSNLVLQTVDQSCSMIVGAGLEVRGSKLIGTPSVLKYDSTYTSNSSGQVSLSSIEWDNYIATTTGSSYAIYGFSPSGQINILPNTSQTYTLRLGPPSSNSFLSTVKNSSTGSLILGATVELKSTSNPVYDVKMTTGTTTDQCSTPGQVMFPSLTTGTKYQAIVGAVGFQTTTVTNLTVKGYTVLSVSLTPSS